jgi:hypothetical protein
MSKVKEMYTTVGPGVGYHTVAADITYLIGKSSQLEVISKASICLEIAEVARKVRCKVVGY